MSARRQLCAGNVDHAVGWVVREKPWLALNGALSRVCGRGYLFEVAPPSLHILQPTHQNIVDCWCSHSCTSLAAHIPQECLAQFKEAHQAARVLASMLCCSTISTANKQAVHGFLVCREYSLCLYSMCCQRQLSKEASGFNFE